MREGQQSTEQANEQRLRFEMLLTDVCVQFVDVAPSEVDSTIENAQRVICESLGVNHSSVWQTSQENPEQLVMTHSYRDPSLKPLPSRPILKDYFPWSQSKILKQEIVCLPSTSNLPPEAAKDMESWRQYGVRSTLAFPLAVGGGPVIGFIAFDSTDERDWPELLQRRLQVLARVIAQALDRRDVDRKLRESESRFRLVADTAPVMIWMSGTDKLCTYFNKPWLHFTGRSMESELGNGWADGVHSEDLQRCMDTYGKAFDHCEEFRMEYRLRRHDGEYRWILDIGVPRFNQDHSFAGYIGSCIDVTERKAAEDRLREYEAAVEGAEDIIGIVDRDYRLILANRQYLKMRNMAKEQVVGRFVPDVLGKEVFETVIKPKLDECFRGNVVRFEMRFSYPIVGERDLLLSYFPIAAANGTIDRVASILHDITDRKRAEEALLEMNRTLEVQGSLLRSREELLNVFVRNVPAGVAMLDRDMNYLQVSDRWCSDYLMGRVQILGRSHYEIFPDMPERWKEVHRRALQGETLRADEDRWDGQDGARWARWEVRPWKTAEGYVGGILIFAEDITHRKQMEEALSDMTRKLVEAHEQERARMARELHDDITQRLAMLAVEIDHMQELHPEIPSEMRGLAHELSRRAKEISSDIQSLSRELHSSALEYLGLEGGMRSWCNEFSERHDLEVTFQSHDVPQQPSHEIALCLFRILQEALQNAAKHSGAKRIEVQLAGNSGGIHLVVSDAGAGFDVKAPGRSRGLGLTSMQERVRLVNGKISIESKPLAGTTIHVSVPLGVKRDHTENGTTAKKDRGATT